MCFQPSEFHHFRFFKSTLRWTNIAIAGTSPVLNRKCIDSIRVHFPASYVNFTGALFSTNIWMIWPYIPRMPKVVGFLLVLFRPYFPWPLCGDFWWQGNPWWPCSRFHVELKPMHNISWNPDVNLICLWQDPYFMAKSNLGSLSFPYINIK